MAGEDNMLTERLDEIRARRLEPSYTRQVPGWTCNRCGKFIPTSSDAPSDETLAHRCKGDPRYADLRYLLRVVEGMQSELEKLREWVAGMREIAKHNAEHLGELCCASTLNEVLAEIDRMIAERVNSPEISDSCGEAQ